MNECLLKNCFDSATTRGMDQSTVSVQVRVRASVCVRARPWAGH